MATVCDEVVTVTTPGDCVDVLVTDYGTAVNPLRQDIIDWLDDAGSNIFQLNLCAIKPIRLSEFRIICNGRKKSLQ